MSLTKKAEENKQLIAGKKVEKEHIDTLKRIMRACKVEEGSPLWNKLLKQVPAWIAGDHIKEFKDAPHKNYYEGLDALEKYLKGEGPASLTKKATLHKVASITETLKPLSAVADDVALLLARQINQADGDKKTLTEVALEKRAGLWQAGKKGLATMGMLGAMAGHADPQLVASVGHMAEQAKPVIRQQIDETITHLPWYMRAGAAVAPIDDIALDLAKAQQNLKALKQHNLPTMEGEHLEKVFTNLRDTVQRTGDVDIDAAMKMNEKVQEFNQKATDALLKYKPNMGSM